MIQQSKGKTKLSVLWDKYKLLSVTSHIICIVACCLISVVNRIPGLRLLISSLPGSAWRTPGSALRTLVESLSKSRNVNKSSQSLAW